MNRPWPAASGILSLKTASPRAGQQQRTLSVQILQDIYPETKEAAVTTLSQSRAIKTYRQRLGERGMARFEVLGRGADRDLIRAVARRLAENGPDAARLRAMLSGVAFGEPPRTGGILAALRGSPLVGADLDLTRPPTPGRVVDV